MSESIELRDGPGDHKGRGSDSLGIEIRAIYAN